MITNPRQRYTAEYKAKAIELMGTGKPVTEFAEELCIGSKLLGKWM
jgi:transposase-like protein